MLLNLPFLSILDILALVPALQVLGHSLVDPMVLLLVLVQEHLVLVQELLVLVQEHLALPQVLLQQPHLWQSPLHLKIWREMLSLLIY